MVTVSRRAEARELSATVRAEWPLLHRSVCGWYEGKQVPRLRMNYASLHSCFARDECWGGIFGDQRLSPADSFDSPQSDYISSCRLWPFSSPRNDYTKPCTPLFWAIPGRCAIYPAAIIGTATSAAIMPTVFHRVKCSPRKMRARITVSAG